MTAEPPPDDFDRRAPAGFRTAPHNIEAEQALLGAILINNAAYHEVAGFLRPEHFYEPAHGRVFAAMRAGIVAGKLVDHVLLKEAFKEDETLRQLDAGKYLAALVRGAEAVANAADYGLVIHELAMKRGLIAAGEELINRAYDLSLPETAGDQLAATRARFDALERETPHASRFMLWPDLEGRKAPPRRFVLPDWIPAFCVTLLHGFGGVGKTLLAQQIATCCVLRREFLGVLADACPVLAWFGEDDENEIWRRQESIDAALEVTLRDHPDLHWWACPGEDITLFKATSEGDYEVTPRLAQLRHDIIETKAKLVILDNASLIAAIAEASRPLVTRCIQVLTGLCREVETTILLIGHNNRTGDFSGSSAWENSARSRMHMKREIDPDTREESIKLIRPKANYASLEEGVALEWKKGAYVCTDRRFEAYGDRLERETRERQIEQAFLEGLEALNRQQRATSANSRASSYAPKMLSSLNGHGGGFSSLEYEKAMQRLFAQGRLVAAQVLPWKTSTRHQATGVGRA